MTEYAHPTEQELDERLKKVEGELKNLRKQADNISGGVSGALAKIDARLKRIEDRLDALDKGIDGGDF